MGKKSTATTHKSDWNENANRNGVDTQYEIVGGMAVFTFFISLSRFGFDFFFFFRLLATFNSLSACVLKPINVVKQS